MASNVADAGGSLDDVAALLDRGCPGGWYWWARVFNCRQFSLGLALLLTVRGCFLPAAPTGTLRLRS